MEEITEIILLDNGLKNDGTDVFSYIGNDYDFGNCFKSYEEAKEAINKIKNVLNQ